MFAAEKGWTFVYVALERTTGACEVVSQSEEGRVGMRISIMIQDGEKEVGREEREELRLLCTVQPCGAGAGAWGERSRRRKRRGTNRRDAVPDSVWLFQDGPGKARRYRLMASLARLLAHSHSLGSVSLGSLQRTPRLDVHNTTQPSHIRMPTYVKSPSASAVEKAAEGEAKSVAQTAENTVQELVEENGQSRELLHRLSWL